MSKKVKIKRIASEWGRFAFRSRPCRVVFIGAFVAIKMMMNITENSLTRNLISQENNSKSRVDDGFVPPPRNDTAPPPGTYTYEPPDITKFWTLPDRRFTRELYPPLAKFTRVLEVGARGYNRVCKGMINSTTTQYYQADPFPPPPDAMNNDGLLQCKVQEVPKLYPQYESFFDVTLDFGVFGWGGIRKQFNTTEDILEDISDYIDGLLFLLKPKGLWILHTHGDDWVHDEKVVFDMFILPHFDMGSFDGHTSGVGVNRNKYHYFFLYRKEESSSR